MANGYKITPSHGVPLTPRLTVDAAQPLLTHDNPQSPNPGFPVLLYDTVTVAPAASNDFRSDAFLNTTSRPIELHAMRALISVSPASILINGGGMIALELAADGVAMTRGAIPIWSMCRSDNRLNDTFANSPVSLYAWYFSNPILLRPGVGITATAKHLGAPAQYTAQVYLSFAGRICPRPIPNRVPYVSAWTSKAWGYSEVGTDISPPKQIVNDTDRDLTIDRIIGRSTAYDDASLGAGNFSYRDFADVSVQAVSSLRTRLSLSRGRPILKTYTPWRAVFGQNAALEADFIMRSGDYLIAEVGHVAGPALRVPFTFSQNSGTVSIVGWREV